MQNRPVPTPPWPRALIGDTDWQDAARDIWDALASLDQKYTPAGLPAAPLDARGLTDGLLIDDAHRSTLEELTDWTLAADRVLFF